MCIFNESALRPVQSISLDVCQWQLTDRGICPPLVTHKRRGMTTSSQGGSSLNSLNENWRRQKWFSNNVFFFFLGITQSLQTEQKSWQHKKLGKEEKNGRNFFANKIILSQIYLLAKTLFLAKKNIVQKNSIKKGFFCMVFTIWTRREIQCLPYAGFNKNLS